MDVLESYFDQGSFGVFKGLSESDPDNPVEKRKALMRKGKAREEWLAWVADHPEAKVTDPETSKAMNEIVGRHVGAEFVAPIPMPSPEQSGPAPTVDDILKRYGAPPAEKTPGQAEIDAENERRAKEAKGKSIKEREREEGKGATTQVSVPYFEPDMPSGGGQPDANPLMTQPPPPESIDDDIRPPAGQSYMQVDEGVLSRLRSSGKQQIVYNRATKKWSKIDPGKVKAGDLLVVQ